MRPAWLPRRRLIAWSALILAGCLAMCSPAMAATSYPSGVTGSRAPFLFGVWCAGPHSCLAVGAQQQGGPASVVWNGRSWRHVKVPNRGVSLQGLACVSWKMCMATGSFGVVDRWNGSAWRRLSTPYSAALASVSCPGRATCLAVGKTDYRGHVTGAILWNGKSWKATPVPRPPGAIRSSLLSVSCTSAASCLAVGTYDTGSRGSLPVAVSWNGSAWHLDAAPPYEMDGISCVSKTWCMAVGFDQAEFWNGSSWKAPPARYPFFRTAVSCLSTRFCASIGVAAIQWTGTDWVYFGFLPGSFYGFAVWCGSHTDCMAVGIGPPATAQWDGHRWHGHAA